MGWMTMPHVPFLTMAIKDRTQLEIWNFWGTHNRTTSHFIKKITLFKFSELSDSS